MTGINVNTGFSVGSANPIDTRQWLSTVDMKNADVNTMPDPYFAINKEDHFLYIFSKTNPISESTGYFTKYTSDGGMTVWKGSEAERNALPEETKADESIIFYTWDTDSAEYKNVVSKTVGTVENMSEADYQALETKDARTIYTTPGHIRVGEESIVSSSGVENLVYTKMGQFLSNPSGYIRARQTIDNILVIGNSLTGIEYSYTRQSGEEFSESRELGCCHPENQWTAQTYKYIRDHINQNFKMYKCLGKPWEAQENGTRSLSSILDANIYNVSDTVATPAGLVLDDVLDSDINVIIIDLYENIQMTSSDIATVTADFEKLYRELAERCPNATIYQFGGFMHRQDKASAVYRACCNGQNFVTIDGVRYQQPRPQLIYSACYAKTCSQNVANGGFDYNSLLCVEGDTVYDVDGNPWKTVPSNWTSHPGDLGYTNIACLVLHNLFNIQSRNDVVSFIPNTTSTVEKPEYYRPNYSISASSEGAIYNYTSLSVYDTMFDYMQFPAGIMRCACYIWDSRLSGAGSYIPSFVEFHKKISSGYSASEKIIPVNRSSDINAIISRTTGSLYATTFRQLLDDTQSSRFNTYSAAKIDELIGGTPVKLAECIGTTDTTLSNINYKGYKTILLLLCNAIDLLLGYKEIPGYIFNYTLYNTPALRTFTVTLDGYSDYTTTMAFTDGAGNGTIHNNSENCRTYLYGIK